MAGSDSTSTQRTTNSDTAAKSPEIVTKYWGIAFFCFLVLLLSYLYVVCVVNALLTGHNRFVRVLLAALMYMSAILSAWAYMRTHCEPIPKVPDRFHFTEEEWRILQRKRLDFPLLRHELEAMAEKRGVRIRTSDGLVNACKTCHVIKPERTHHCSVCKKCVLRMDHHCPWFGNCIHFYNYKFFLQAIFYAVLGMLYMFLSSIVIFIVESNPLDRLKAVNWALPGFILLCLIIIFVGVPATGFFYGQLKSAVRNETTLEGLKGEVYFAGGIDESYNLGSYRRNIEQQFGPVLLAWLIPIKSTAGDGTQFLVRSDVIAEQQQQSVPNKVPSYV